jgi:hypothetical protein
MVIQTALSSTQRRKEHKGAKEKDDISSLLLCDLCDFALNREVVVRESGSARTSQGKNHAIDFELCD